MRSSVRTRVFACSVACRNVRVTVPSLPFRLLLHSRTRQCCSSCCRFQSLRTSRGLVRLSWYVVDAATCLVRVVLCAVGCGGLTSCRMVVLR